MLKFRGGMYFAIVHNQNMQFYPLSHACTYATPVQWIGVKLWDRVYGRKHKRVHKRLSKKIWVEKALWLSRLVPPLFSTYNWLCNHADYGVIMDGKVLEIVAIIKQTLAVLALETEFLPYVLPTPWSTTNSHTMKYGCLSSLEGYERLHPGWRAWDDLPLLTCIRWQLEVNRRDQVHPTKWGLVHLNNLKTHGLVLLVRNKTIHLLLLNWTIEILDEVIYLSSL